MNSKAPNDGFLQKVLETLFMLAEYFFQSLETHSKKRYKICICSVILGQLESFRNFKCFSIIFPKMLIHGCNLKLNERENFSISSLHHIFESEIFKFSFSTKNSLTRGSKM